MEEEYVFDQEYLKKITDLIILSTTTENNNIRQTYFFELLELEMDTLKMKNTLFTILKSDIFDNMNDLNKQAFIIKFKDFFFKNKEFLYEKEKEDLEKIKDTIKFLLNIFFAKKLNKKNLSFFVMVINIYIEFLLKESKKGKVQTKSQTGNFLFEIDEQLKIFMSNISFTLNGDAAEENLHKIILIYEDLIIHIHENGSKHEASKMFTENYFNILMILFKTFIDEKNINALYELIETLLISFHNVSLELCKSYMKDKNIKLVRSELNKNKTKNNESLEKEYVEPYFNNDYFLLFLKTIFYLTENKILIFIECAKNHNLIDIKGEITSEEFSKDEKNLMFFNISESRINTLKTINLKILFKLLTLLGNKNINIKCFPNLFASINKIALDYIKLLGDIFTFNIDSRTNIFTEKKNESPYEKKLIVYLSNILEMLRLLYKYPETMLNELFENRLEIFAYVLIPIIKIKPLEVELFNEDNIDDFYKLLLDMSVDQYSTVPKIRALKVIDTMCTNMDGFLKFLAKFFIDLLYFGIVKITYNDSLQEQINNLHNPFFNKSIITKNQLKPATMKYSGSPYPTTQDSFFGHSFKILTNETHKKLFEFVISTMSPEDLIELPLQIFSCLSYLISDESGLEKQVEEKFDNVNHYLIAINNQFLKAKLCNFYSYNLDSFYHDTQNILSKSFDDSVNFLFNCLLSEEQNLNLNYTALESIDPLIFENDVKQVVKDFVVIYSKNIFNMMHNKRLTCITQTLKFRDFINNLIEHYAQEITHCAETIFNHFWMNLLNGINEFLLEKAKIVNLKNLKNLDKKSNFNAESIDKDFLKSTEINAIQLESGIFNTLQILLEKIKHIPSKMLIYNKIFSLMVHLKDLLDFYHEEEVLELIKIAIIDIKLLPIEFNEYLENLLNALEPKLNLINEPNFSLESYNFNNEYEIEKDKYGAFFRKYKEENKLQTYHIHFMFSFLKNVKFDEIAVNFYKNKILKMIIFNLNKDLFVFKYFFSSNNSAKNVELNDKIHEIEKINKLNIGLYLKMLYCFIIFYWTTLNFDTDIVSILETLSNLISEIKNEELVSKIQLCYYLIYLKFDEEKILDKIVNFKYFDLFIVKSFVSCNYYNPEDLFDISIASYYYSNTLFLIFHYFYDKIKSQEEHGFDSSYVNFCKFLINANIDNLIKLEKYNKNKLDLENFKKEFMEDNKRKRGKLFKDLLNEKEIYTKNNDEEMNSDNDSDLDMFATKAKTSQNKKIPKIDFESDESKLNSNSSEWGDSLEESFEDYNSDGDEEFSDEGPKKPKKNKNKKSFNLHLKGIFGKNEVTEYMNQFGSEQLKKFFINIDEFQLFKEILMKINQSDEQVFSKLIEDLPENKKKFLNVIKDYKKIEIENKLKIRKYLKIKRSDKQ